jgi:hypothetical protein
VTVQPLLDPALASPSPSIKWTSAGRPVHPAVDPTWGCQLAAAALQELLGCPIVVGRRSASPEGDPLVRHGADLSDDPGGLVIPLGDGEDGWVLMLTSDATERWSPAAARIVSALSGFLRNHAEPASQSAGVDPTRLETIVAATAAGDPAGYVVAVHDLMGGAVQLRDQSGTAVAEAGVDGGRAARRRSAGRDDRGERELVLRDQGSVVGTLRLPPGPFSQVLADLATALLRVRAGAERQRELQSRLAVVSCLAPDLQWPQLATPGPVSSPPGQVRPVVLSALTPIDGIAGHRLRDELIRRGPDDLVLDGLSLTLADGQLLGVYPDDDRRDPAEHRRAWTALLRSSRSPYSPLTVMVGCPSQVGQPLRQQYLLARTVARLQTQGSRLLRLPQVTVLEELGPVVGMLLAGDGHVAAFIERVLGDLLADDRVGGQLIETLHAYLQSGGSPSATGEVLHLHTSSVKYRIGIIRKLIGQRLNDPDHRFELELAVRMHLALRELEHVDQLPHPGASCTRGDTPYPTKESLS